MFMIRQVKHHRLQFYIPSGRFVQFMIMLLLVSCAKQQKSNKQKTSLAVESHFIAPAYTPGSLEFDVKEVPFSKKGSYMSCSSRGLTDDDEGLFIWDVSGRGEDRGIIKIEPIYHGDIVASTITATPEKLTFNTEFGELGISFDGDQVLRFYSEHGLGVKLSVRQSYVLPRNDHQLRIIQGAFLRYMLSTLRGEMQQKENKVTNGIIINIEPEDNGIIDFVIEEYESEWNEHGYSVSFSKAVEEVRNQFSEWMRTTLPVNKEYEHTRVLAAYINWSSIVAPRGLLKRPTMLMSKNWMHRVWSWDHCFNALALAEGNPQLAWDQFMVMFDQQHENGALPDCMDDYSMIRGYVKPPVHGWALDKLMMRGVVTKERMKEIYEPLTRWTDFWMNYRDDDKNGMPQYHHGNDSGWDNGSVFAENRYVEGPELSAYLIIQMNVLAKIARKLGRTSDAVHWDQKANTLLNRLIDRSWVNGKFVSKYVGSDNWNKNSKSLMAFLPLLLGERLPIEIREKMIHDLCSDEGYATLYGPATEHLQSLYYKEDGYWRGAIWAPTTYLIIDGLVACGETHYAKEMTTRFVNMCNENGFGENFDPLTGTSLRDPAYTWTASVFLLLAHANLE
ncbi:amylo-alpha-1,6-glucosidase [Zhouia amylolytica]|uniref:amylo-alpha-1,6-glucosidase n=1 Tax=Zhouia amylolytica TaxID=376730 RepID=UPI0020CBCF05|nr:trehalase family glycosidase [Zhouia amylolytica]MCQ0112456.1 hypothetical protein [Zhouia amylolytica]